MNRVRDYFRGLAAIAGSNWNRFWYQPSDGFDLCVLRIFVGSLALVWQLSYTPDLMRWFGPQGWFDAGVLDQWLTAESTLGFSGRLSFLYTPTLGALWSCHIASGVALLAFTLGAWTRLTSVLSFAIVLAYIHRAPFVCGATEVVLAMLVGYLCLAPCGRALSIDVRRNSGPPAHLITPWATSARRLLQVHLVAIYGIMALSKLVLPRGGMAKPCGG